jgi:1-aminocyclopropane-1-carboxylate deaminase/D-cysteine desulfhydrase-like pyridoxal-dependent ACC family enzyme
MSEIASAMSTEQLARHIERVPRVRLGHLPTPLEELRQFSIAMDGPRIFIKRDDCTGLAFGGNKTRHNEFLLADALEKGADMVVWGAGVQSNNCRQTMAACAKFGLDCHLVLSRATGHEKVEGNLLIDHLLGASYEIVDARLGPELDDVITERASQFRAKGRKVYGWDRKVLKQIAAVSYVQCMVELADQLTEQQIDPVAVYVCSGSSTGAGLALGKVALGLTYPIRSILPLHWPWDTQEDLARIANDTAELLGLTVRLRAQDVDVRDGYVGPGYGLPSVGGMEAISLLARTEAILLDPVYTGKAMAALIDHVREGWYASDQAIVFVHTGGTPALFAYRDELLDMIPGVSND